MVTMRRNPVIAITKRLKHARPAIPVLVTLLPGAVELVGLEVLCGAEGLDHPPSVRLQ
jgi:hypothetical protein